jgi:hypothetical protein
MNIQTVIKSDNRIRQQLEIKDWTLLLIGYDLLESQKPRMRETSGALYDRGSDIGLLLLITGGIAPRQSHANCTSRTAQIV